MSKIAVCSSKVLFFFNPDMTRKIESLNHLKALFSDAELDTLITNAAEVI